MGSLGQELKRERELRAISLQDIANQTKIGLRALQALENDKLDLLPGTFFIKGILRAYSRSIGVDAEYFVNKYHEEILLQEDARDKDRKRREEVPREKARRIRPRFRLWAALLLIAACACAALIFVTIGPRKIPRPPAQIPTVTTIQPSAGPKLPAVVSPDTANSNAGIRLDLAFLAETWILIAADGQVVLDGLYEAGKTATCNAAKEFVIQIGNAGGVAMSINGRPAKSFGAAGQVLTDIRIDRNNWADFLK
jgi:transcriptional regulator with XRE-family HTH domain